MELAIEEEEEEEEVVDRLSIRSLIESDLSSACMHGNGNAVCMILVLCYCLRPGLQVRSGMGTHGERGRERWCETVREKSWTSI